MKVKVTPLLVLLGVVLVVLRGSGVIDWPWVWVTAPLWITVLIGLSLLVILFILAILNILMEDR